MKGVRAFREAFMSADYLISDDFEDFEVRKVRYQVLWAFYENTAYSSIHKWAQRYKSENGLYRFIRNIYNPAYRLGEFWKIHLMGGLLDPDAGDGSAVPSALPIITDNEKLRPVIAQIWRHSNWQVKKSIFSLWGAVLGDVALEVVDNPARQRVYLRVVHPGTIKDVELDDLGNIKAYELEEEREDKNGSSYLYGEKAFRDGQNVVYQTFRDGRLTSFNGNPAEWQEEYGFIPMVKVQHNDVGFDWGWSEMHAGRVKFQEVDDLASKLSDQIRRMVHAPFLFSGVSKPDRKQATSDRAGSASGVNPDQSEREDMPAIWGPPGASATPLVAPLSIGETSQYILEILKSIEQDYPELSVDIHNVQGDISGRALRINQRPAANKVIERRPNYDDALVRAHKMAISIGAMKKYGGFEAFSAESYDKGELDHYIGNRPVFETDPLDDLEIESKLWEVANAAKNSGVSLPVFLRRRGWSEEKINEIMESPEYKARVASLQQLARLGETTEGEPNG